MLSSANTENPFSWALTPPPTISSFAKTELCLPGQLYISNFFPLSLVHKILPDFLGFSESWLTFGFGSCWTIDLHEFSFTVSPKVLVSNWGLAATPKTHFCGLCLPDFSTLPRSLFIPACLFQATLNWGKFSWCGSHILKPFPSLPSSRLRAQQKQIPLGMAWIKKLNRTGSEKDCLFSIWDVPQLWACGKCSEHLLKAAGLEESQEFPCSSSFPLHASFPPGKIHSVLPILFLHYKSMGEEKKACLSFIKLQ